MLRLELRQQLGLPLLLARGQAGLLLALVVHHLLDHAARLAVEVAEARVLGLDARHVDGGRGGDDVRPPLELVGLVEVDVEGLEGRGGGGGGRQRRERPGGLVDVDGVGEVALRRQSAQLLLHLVLRAPRLEWQIKGSRL